MTNTNDLIQNFIENNLGKAIGDNGVEAELIELVEDAERRGIARGAELIIEDPESREKAKTLIELQDLLNSLD